MCNGFYSLRGTPAAYRNKCTLVLRYWAVADMASFGVFGSCDGHVPMNLFNKMSILKASFLVAQHVGHKWSQLEFIPSLHLGGIEKRISGG